MATFSERLRLIFDVDASNAERGVKGIRKSVQDADGAWGKFRAGMSAATASMRDFVTSGPGMVSVAGVAGAALISFADKAQQLALKIGNLSEATGLSTEAASRWVEVAGDVGIEADRLAGLVEKMTRNLGASPEKFKALGIQLQYAKDGSVDMNATLLSAIGVLHDITDPTRRAAVAQQLFGKSWADAAELITASSADLSKRLESVDSAKIMSPDDIKRAREYRDAMDKLSDVGEDLAISLGKLVIPTLTTVANVLGDVVDIANDVDGAVKSASGGFLDLTDVVLGVGAPLLEVVRIMDKLGAFNDATPALARWAEAAGALKDETAGAGDAFGRVTDAIGGAWDVAKDFKKTADQTAEAERRSADAAWDLVDARRALLDTTLGVRGATRTYQDSVDDLNKAFDDAATTKDEYAESLDRAAGDALRVADATVDAAKAQAVATGKTYDARDATRDQIIALQDLAAGLDPNSPLRKRLEEYILALRTVPASVVTSLSLSTKGGGMGVGATRRGMMEGRASGGPVRAGETYLVGENGPEVLQMGGAGGNVIPNNKLSGAGTNITLNVNVAPTANPAEVGHAVIDALKAAARQGGTNPWG